MLLTLLLAVAGHRRGIPASPARISVRVPERLLQSSRVPVPSGGISPETWRPPQVICSGMSLRSFATASAASRGTSGTSTMSGSRISP